MIADTAMAPLPLNQSASRRKRVAGNPVEAQSGSLRTFVMGGSDHPNHTVLGRQLQDFLRWRNAHARHPDVLAAQRRERARIRTGVLREHQPGTAGAVAGPSCDLTAPPCQYSV